MDEQHGNCQKNTKIDQEPDLRLQAWVALDTNLMELQCVVAGRNSMGSGKWHGDKCLRLL